MQGFRPTLTGALRNAVLRHRALQPTIYSRSISSTIKSSRIPSIIAHTHLQINTRGHQLLSRYSTLQKSTFSDPSRPGLFYHLVEPPTPFSKSEPAFAVSFLETSPVAVNSSTIIGWLPATASEGQQAGLHDFKENSKFRTLLHAAIKSGLEKEVDDIQKNGAIQLREGWMHIHDDRNIPPLGRIGDPDDIIATVLVQDSKILPETYQPMPSYRMCTADGLITLTPGLAQHLQTHLVKQAESDKASS